MSLIARLFGAKSEAGKRTVFVAMQPDNDILGVFSTEEAAIARARQRENFWGWVEEW